MHGTLQFTIHAGRRTLRALTSRQQWKAEE
jgi:hypothetical protein